MKKQVLFSIALVSVAGASAMQKGNVYHYNGKTKPVLMTPAPIAKPVAPKAPAPKAAVIQSVPKAAVATAVMQKGNVYNYNGGTKPVLMGQPNMVKPAAVQTPVAPAPKAAAIQAAPKAAAATVAIQRSCKGGNCVRKAYVIKPGNGGCRNGKCGMNRPAIQK